MFKARLSKYFWKVITYSRLDIKTLMPIKKAEKATE